MPVFNNLSPMISPQADMVDVPDVEMEPDNYSRDSSSHHKSSHGCRCRRCIENDRLDIVESHLKRTIKRWFFIALAISWVIIIGYVLYYYFLGPSLSERLDVIADDPRIKIHGTPAMYSTMVRSLGERTGWASNQRFGAWYNSHAERVHASYKSVYERRGMGHTRLYERGGGLNGEPVVVNVQ